MIIEVISFAVATVLFSILGLVMLTGQRDNLQKKLLATASIVSAIWYGTVTYQAGNDTLFNATLLLELLRSLAWFVFLLSMLRIAYKTTPKIIEKYKISLSAMTIFIVGLMLLVSYRLSGGNFLEEIAGNDVLIGHLIISICGIVIIEQLYRNTADDHLWALKYMWFAIGGMYVYDFYLYSDALLFQRIDNELWIARGMIHAMVVPLIAITIKREMTWPLGKSSMDIFISRRMVFYTTTLLAAGLYMIGIGFGGYYVREYGGTWGVVAQATFVFAAGLSLAILFFSRKTRSRLKVIIDKNFFNYRYDYREEWLRIIRTLSASDEHSRLHVRAIRSLAQVIDSPAGALWMLRDHGRYVPEEYWNLPVINNIESADSLFVKFMQKHQFVINIDEYNLKSDVYTRLDLLEIPEWINNIKNAWLLIPLMLHDSLIGFILLTRSPSQHKYFNWEDSDLLKTAARQAASHLAQYESARELLNAKRFDEFNRLSTFIVHDLKNMIGQLSLVVSNASRHKHNPLFMDDAISTVENTVEKMNKLLPKLKGGGDEIACSFDIFELLEEIVCLRNQVGAEPIPVLINCQSDKINIIAERDRMMANLCHIIQNSQDATDYDGKITIRLKSKNQYVIIEVEDTGCGMDEHFIHEKLFRPFESTKGTMGIGVFQVKEYMLKLGGELEVESQLDKGTIFKLMVPIDNKDNVITHLSAAVTRNVSVQAVEQTSVKDVNN